MESDTAQILEKYTYFLFDCDGVIWNQHKVIDGAVDLIKLLKKLNKKVFFVTNNSTRSRKVVFEHAEKLGFNEDGDTISLEQFYPASYVTALYCKNVLNTK